MSIMPRSKKNRAKTSSKRTHATLPSTNGQKVTSAHKAVASSATRVKEASPNQTASDRSRFRARLLKRYSLLLFGLLVLSWALIPAVRGVTLVANTLNRSAPAAPSDLPVQEVHFRANDGVQLAGWLVIASPQAPTIILVHGFKASRANMLPWARFLYAGGYNVLLYDSRGCGESEGWAISLGTHDPEDVIGAVKYLQKRSDLQTKQFGALGVSMGAGVVLLAAAHEPGLVATVADSPWINQDFEISRMNNLSGLPLLPYEPALVDALLGAHLAEARPLDVIGQIAPRAVMIIHSADDHNLTTPPAGALQLYAAASQPKQEWTAPSGGHAGALGAHKDEYEQRVLAFFASDLPILA